MRIKMKSAHIIPESTLLEYIHKETAGTSFIFYTLSGAHLYGFPSHDSDFDIRGCHIMDAREICGLNVPKDFIERMEGDIDFVSFDIRKELGLVLQNNSNVLEHIFAPPLVTGPSFPHLKKIAGLALSKKVFNPYHGLALFNRKKYLERENSAPDKPSVKKYLYVLRSLMAGIYALEQGRIEPDICTLNRHFKYPVVDDLISIKINGMERGLVGSCREVDALIGQLFSDLESAKENSRLPDNPPKEVFEMANDFLLDCRGV
jgi:predicted nucleotidyltransferase